MGTDSFSSVLRAAQSFQDYGDTEYWMAHKETSYLCLRYVQNEKMNAQTAFSASDSITERQRREAKKLCR